MKYKKIIIILTITTILIFIGQFFRETLEYESKLNIPIDFNQMNITVKYYPDLEFIEEVKKIFESAGWKFKALSYEETDQDKSYIESKYELNIPEYSMGFHQDKYTQKITFEIIDNISNKTVYMFKADYIYRYVPIFITLGSDENAILKKFEYQLKSISKQ